MSCISEATRKKYVGFGLSCVEWYDFAIYSALSAILGELFFNFHDPLLNLLYSFTTFSIAYITRPLGSSIFGYLAVKTHNDISIKYSLLLMTLSTVLIGLLPVNEFFSWFSVFLLCILRLIQGIAMGGCYGASYLYVSQTAKNGHKNRATAFVCMGFMLGFILGNSVVSLCYFFFSDAFMSSIGWRIPFLLGGIFSTILFLILNKIETQKDNQHQKPDSTITSFKQHIKHIPIVFKCVIVIGLDMIGFYLFFVFNTQYLIALQFDSAATITIKTTFMMLFLSCLIWIFSYITDKTSNLIILLISTILFIILGCTFPWTHSLHYITALCMLGTCYGALPNWVIAQFSGKHAGYYTGLSFNMASAIFAGATPLVATILSRYHINYLKLVIIAIGIIILLTLYMNFLTQNNQKNITKTT